MSAEVKDFPRTSRANGQSGLRTAGMALVELMMLFASIKAKNFQEKPTVKNMTDWCNAVQLIDEPHVVQAEKWRKMRHTIRRKVNT